MVIKGLKAPSRGVKEWEVPGSSFSFQGTDPISQTKVAELLGESDSGRTSQEGPGSSVKFEGGEDASVFVEWSGVSLNVAP